MHGNVSEIAIDSYRENEFYWEGDSRKLKEGVH